MVSLVRRQDSLYGIELIRVMWKLILSSAQKRESGSALRPSGV